MQPKIEILRTWSNRVTFPEALELAKGQTFASNEQIDAILQDENARSANADLFPCWTGTLLVYEAPNTPFGKFVKDTYSGWIIDIPKKFQGLKNKALVLEHPDFTLE